MISVGVRDLKNRLSAYLRLVRAGEVILVTDHGEVVAELRRATSPGAVGDAQANDVPFGLERLARGGPTRVGLPNRPDVYDEMPAALEAGLLQRLLDEERADR